MQRQSGGGVYLPSPPRPSQAPLSAAVPEMATSSPAFRPLRAPARRRWPAAPAPRRWAKALVAAHEHIGLARLAHHRLGGHAQGAGVTPWRGAPTVASTNCCSRRQSLRSREVGAQLHRLVGADWTCGVMGCQPRLAGASGDAQGIAHAQPAGLLNVACSTSASWPLRAILATGMPASSLCPGRNRQLQHRARSSGAHISKPVLAARRRPGPVRSAWTAFLRNELRLLAGGAAVLQAQAGDDALCGHSCSSRASLLAARRAGDWACSNSRCQTSSSRTGKACHDLAGPDALAGRHQHLLHHAHQRAAQQIRWPGGGSSTWQHQAGTGLAGAGTELMYVHWQLRSGQLSSDGGRHVGCRCAGADQQRGGEQVGPGAGLWAVGGQTGAWRCLGARSRSD